MSEKFNPTTGAWEIDTNPLSAAGLSTFSPSAATSGSPVLLTVTGPAHTTLEASTEAPDVNFNLARTVQFATGALTTQRAVRFQAPTYGFVANSTITDAVTLEISGPPVAGTNATITRAHALRVASGQSSFGGPVVVGSGSTAGVAGNGLTIAPAARTSGSPSLLTVTAPADTTLTASTESCSVNINTSATRQFATGALTAQREVRIQAPTYAFVANSTITNAATLAISDAPQAGTNATITNAYALWVQAGVSRFDGNVSLGPGIHLACATGSSNLDFSLTTGSIKLGGASATIGLFGATAVAQPSSTGQTAGFTAGSGTAAKDDSTFTGGSGSKAYTFGDVVKHLKAVGILAAS